MKASEAFFLLGAGLIFMGLAVKHPKKTAMLINFLIEVTKDNATKREKSEH